MKLTYEQKKQLCTEITSYFIDFEVNTAFGRKYNSSFVVKTKDGDQIGLAAYFSWHAIQGTLVKNYFLESIIAFAIDMMKDKYRFLTAPTYSMDAIEASSAIEHLEELQKRYEGIIKEENELSPESSDGLNAKINELEAKLNGLIEENNTLKERVTTLEARLEKPNSSRRSLFF